jgi:hypothetical protein
VLDFPDKANQTNFAQALFRPPCPGKQRRNQLETPRTTSTRQQYSHPVPRVRATLSSDYFQALRPSLPRHQAHTNLSVPASTSRPPPRSVATRICQLPISLLSHWQCWRPPHLRGPWPHAIHQSRTLRLPTILWRQSHRPRHFNLPVCFTSKKLCAKLLSLSAGLRYEPDFIALCNWRPQPPPPNPQPPLTLAALANISSTAKGRPAKRVTFSESCVVEFCMPEIQSCIFNNTYKFASSTAAGEEHQGKRKRHKPELYTPPVPCSPPVPTQMSNARKGKHVRIFLSSFCCIAGAY